jgi:hypothetical protein
MRGLPVYYQRFCQLYDSDGNLVVPTGLFGQVQYGDSASTAGGITPLPEYSACNIKPGTYTFKTQLSESATGFFANLRNATSLYREPYDACILHDHSGVSADRYSRVCLRHVGRRRVSRDLYPVAS